MFLTQNLKRKSAVLYIQSAQPRAAARNSSTGQSGLLFARIDAAVPGHVGWEAVWSAGLLGW